MYEEVVRFRENKERFIKGSESLIEMLGEVKKILEFVELDSILGLYSQTEEGKQKLKSINEDLEELINELEEI